MLPSSLGRKAELSLLSVVSVPSRPSSFAAIFNSIQRRTEISRRINDDWVSLGTKTPSQITSPCAAILLRFCQGLIVYLKDQIFNHQGKVSMPRWKGRKLFLCYLPTWVWFMPLPISVSIPPSLSTQLLNTEDDRVTTKNLAESSLFRGYLWTLALKFS